MTERPSGVWPNGTKVAWRYTGAPRYTGTITGVARTGRGHRDTRYRIQLDGPESLTVCHDGRVLEEVPA